MSEDENLEEIISWVYILTYAGNSELEEKIFSTKGAFCLSKKLMIPVPVYIMIGDEDGVWNDGII